MFIRFRKKVCAMSKNSFIFLLGCIFIFANTFLAYANDRFTEEFYSNYRIANASAISIKNSFPLSENGDIIYPDYFGGMFIDENGNLVVLTHVEFSYADLNELFSHISNFLIFNWRDNGHAVAQNVHAIGIDVINNRVNIYVSDDSEYSMMSFKDAVSNHPALAFIQVSLIK